MISYTPYPPVKMKRDGVWELKKKMSVREIIVYKNVQQTRAVYLSHRHMRVRYAHICTELQVSATLHCEFELENGNSASEAVGALRPLH